MPKKQHFSTKLYGRWATEVHQEIATRYISLQTLKLPTENFVHNFISRLAYQKTTICTKIDRIIDQASDLKEIIDCLRIFETVEASNLKFYTLIDYETTLT